MTLPSSIRPAQRARRAVYEFAATLLDRVPGVPAELKEKANVSDDRYIVEALAFVADELRRRVDGRGHYELKARAKKKKAKA